MRNAATTAGWIAAWVLLTGAFFVGEDLLTKPPVRLGDVVSVERYVVQRLADAVAEKRLGCAALALVQNGRIRLERGFGVVHQETNAPVNPTRTLFLVSSVSKAVTAWGVLKLVQDGKLGLDEPVVRYLRRWRFPGSEAHREEVTARHLLSHTAGFVDGYGHGGFLPGEPRQTLEESLDQPADANVGQPHPAVVVNQPGTIMAYSSAGYAVLQLLVEERTGRAFNDYMTETVLRPLGMTQSGYELDALVAEGRESDLAPNYDLNLTPHPHRRYTNLAGVSLRATAHDLARLVVAYSRQNPVLTPESLKQFAAPQPGTSCSWGLGHTLYGKTDAGGCVVGHGGGGFPASGAEMRVNPATGNGIVILATGTQGLISDIADVWTYWETGHKPFGFRNVVRRRGSHAIAVVVLGVVGIVLWRNGKRWNVTIN